MQQIVGLESANVKMQKTSLTSRGQARNSFDCHEIFRSGKLCNDEESREASLSCV